MRTKKVPDLLHLTESPQHFATAAVYGEHLWLAIIYTNMIHHFQEHGFNFPIVDAKVSPRTNGWKHIVLKQIVLLLMLPKKCGASRNLLVGKFF